MKFSLCRSGIGLILCLLMILVIFPLPSLGAAAIDDNDELELTLDEAIDRALATSSNLKLADYDIERNEEVRQKAAERVQYTPTDGSNEDALNAFISLVQSDLSWQMSRKTKEVREDTIIKTVFDRYTSVLMAQEKVLIAEKTLANESYKRLEAVIGYQVGKVSLSNKILAEANYVTKEVALNESRADLEDSYIQLNSFIGLNLQDRPLLKYDPVFVPLKINNLEADVQRRLEVDPNLWLTDKNVEKAELDLDLFNWNGSTSYHAKEIDLEKTRLNAVEDKEQTRLSIYSIYSNILRLEEQYKTTEQNLRLAEDNLSISQLKYQLGMISKGEVLAAELDVANARTSLKSIIYQHEAQKMSFDKPWA